MTRAWLITLLILLSFSTLSLRAQAEGVGLLNDTGWASDQASRGYMLAQFESDDSYDPFADYSEFDEASEE
ncbi:MAG: hypothetical protein KDD43_05180, partial [Bdellovibrionales bacterium]|nr:hypothetical protein [Bdellovibrionales bacterium]